ncbi:hypothetical protein CFOL_v3_21392, partial [Cephalotus follicularis]
IALTSDAWTSTNESPYIYITSHYVDSKWHLQKRILSFRLFKHPHTGNDIIRAIKQEFRRICHEHGLKYKTLIINVRHRWNSTYEMCKLAYEYRHPLFAFCSSNAHEYYCTE